MGTEKVKEKIQAILCSAGILVSIAVIGASIGWFFFILAEMVSPILQLGKLNYLICFAPVALLIASSSLAGFFRKYVSFLPDVGIASKAYAVISFALAFLFLLFAMFSRSVIPGILRMCVCLCCGFAVSGIFHWLNLFGRPFEALAEKRKKGYKEWQDWCVIGAELALMAFILIYPFTFTGELFYALSAPVPAVVTVIGIAVYFIPPFLLLFFILGRNKRARDPEQMRNYLLSIIYFLILCLMGSLLYPILQFYAYFLT